MNANFSCRLTVRNVVAILIALFSGQHASGQNRMFPTREVNNLLSAAALGTSPGSNVLYIANDARSTMLSDGTFPSKVKYKSNITLVRLAIDHASLNVPKTPYSYKMLFELKGSKKVNDSTYNFTVVDSVAVSWNADSLSAFQDQNVKIYPDLFNARLTIIDFYDASTGSVPTPIPLATVKLKNLQVELAMQYQPYLKTHYQPNDMALSVSHTYIGSSGSLGVGWAPSNPPYLGKVTPASYELEWTYADNYSTDTNALAASAVRYNFRNNATRVLLDTTGYRIPVVYPKGFIVYRVRMIRVDSVSYRYPLYGPWSISTVSGLVSGAGSSYYQILKPHAADSINWNYAIQFAEGGKYKHVQSYYDGLLKNRQTITRFNSNPNQLLVTEKIYDYEGRPEITTLPAVVSTPAFGYVDSVSMSSTTNGYYGAADFDQKPALCPDLYTIPPFLPKARANRYYSTLNTDTAGMQKFVPRANGFPFVHTQLSAGYSDRVDIQGGAGDSLQIGRGHDVRNQYMSADQSELNRMFGLNAGYNNFYTKTVSKDQNGQYSMSVKDFRGRPVLTSLIGAAVDTTKHAIMFNDEVPNNKTFREDKLDSAVQLVVHHRKTYNGSLYMDEAALTNIEYQYTFKPYILCGSSDAFVGLSVKGEYDYNFTDECGVTELSRSGTIGQTGMVYSNPGPSSVYDTLTLKKGKHAIQKNLSIRTDEIYAAVDSFFVQGPFCGRKTEAEFIKTEVENTPFPCPDSLTDECADLEKKMLEEMFPDGKYGKIPGSHTPSVSPGSPVAPAVAGTYSVFDRVRDPLTGEYKYRYFGASDTGTGGNPCIVSRINSISFSRFGRTYTNLASMPMDTFLAIYQDAGIHKYDIARALLPLHPEYCKLKNCFIDTFEQRFKSFPDAASAERYGFFALNDIVTKDAQLRSKLYFVTGISDSLKTILGGRVRLDTFISDIAFCLADQARAYGDAREFFGDDIRNLVFPDTRTKNYYFEKMRGMYLGNRARYKSVAAASPAPDCSQCGDSSYRLPLIAPPLIPTLYTPGGKIDTSANSVFGMFSDTGSNVKAQLSAWLGAADSLVADTAVQRKYKDSAESYVRRMDSLLNYIAVDSVLSKLRNCYSSNTLKYRMRDTLIAMIRRGEVHNGTFMPWQVRYAITSSGLSLSGLCHPYLFNYDYFHYAGAAKPASCKTGAFYSDVRAFLNKSDVNQALRQTTTTPTAHSISWDNTNLFAAEISAALGTTSIGMTTSYNSASKTFRLVFASTVYMPTPPEPVVVILQAGKPSPVNSGEPFFYNPYTLDFEYVSCYFEDPQAMADGYIGRFMFRVGVARLDFIGVVPVVSRAQLNAWSNTVHMAEGDDNPLASGISCTQFKDLYKAFADTMTAYGAYAGDHPLFVKSLTNFANFAFKKIYGGNQYGRFLQSCALADSMRIPAYGGYGRVSFSGSAAPYTSFAQFRAAVAGNLGFTVLQLVADSASGKDSVVIDYNSVPYHELRRFDSLVMACGGKIATPLTGSIGTLYMPQSNVSGATITNVLAGTGFSAGTPQTVYVRRGGSPVSYYRYVISTTGTPTHAQVSAGIDRVDDNLYTNSVRGYWVPNAFATVNRDYYKPQKQQYLRYAYSLQGKTPGNIMDALQEPFVESNVTAFGGVEVSYTDPQNPARRTNLYYANAADTFAGFSVLKNMFSYAAGTLGTGQAFIANSSKSVPVATVPSGHSMNLYRCADGLYWYRYFGAGKKLYNAYVRIPGWVHLSAHPGLTIAGIRLANGDTATRRFRLLLTSSGFSGDTVVAEGSTDFDIAWSRKLSDVLLGSETPGMPADAVSGEPGSRTNCEQKLLYNAILKGEENYARYLDSFRTALRAAFYAHVMSQVGEKLYVEYIDKRFAYTLYHYDLAGNLIVTVPPDGVHPLADTSLGTVNTLRNAKAVGAAWLPQHTKETFYEYNTFNKPVRELTPDAGQKTMSYDGKGNVILSQSQKQRATGLFTYMLYDGQNRLTETGQVKWADCPVFADQPLYTKTGSVYTKNNPPNACACENITDSVWTYCVPNTISTYDNTLFAKKIRQMARKMVVATVYDAELVNLSVQPGMSRQENLRSRIGANMYFESVPADTGGAAPKTNYSHASHYSYDVAGNVKTLVQEFPELTAVRQRYKRVDYEYDLLSGKVNMLAYNRGYADQMYQRYSYDADNRITLAESSRDGFVWKRDAGYTYYQHGPLARVSIGDQRVQGLDYAYTIQGWLKSINGDRADSTRDMGGDGRSKSVTPRDVYATSIDYFKGDYQPIGATPLSTLPQTAKSLYNGNIARQTTDVTPFGALTTAYTYDQMNRIRKAAYAKDSAAALQFNNWYASAYRYDLDGNIKSLTRREGSGTLMDTLVYQYPNAGQDNKLTNVLDYSTYSAAPGLDLPGYTVTNTTRFSYDADGNLTGDATSGTSNIQWNIYGKTSDLSTGAGQLFHFGYDATGNRVSKKWTTSPGGGYRHETGTYYVRDAQGNILAEYNAGATYNEQSRVSVITSIRTSVGGTYPTRTWIDVLNSGGYLAASDFSDYISTISASAITYPAGYYLAADPSLRGQFISNVGDLHLGLAAYSQATRVYPTARTLLHGMASPMYTPGLEATDVIGQITHTVLTHPNTAVRQHAVEQMATYAPDLLSQVLSDFSITLTNSSDSVLAMQSMYGQATGGGGPVLYKGRILALYGDDPDLVRPWLEQVTADSAYLDGYGAFDGYTGLLQSALSTFGDDAAQAEGMAEGRAKYASGMYAGVSWWDAGAEIVAGVSVNPLGTIGYNADPVSYLHSLIGIRGVLGFLDTALSLIPDGSVDMVGLGNSVGVSLSGVQTSVLAGVPYLEQQYAYLGNHHLYGSSRLGIAQYEPHQYRYLWDYQYGQVDTFGTAKGRPWYSYALNAPVRAGATVPYGNRLDSAAEGSHIVGMKQYELVNHLGNVQGTVSDKKYAKDVNNDSLRDGYRAASVSVYDYYPFGMLMPGRTMLDTVGMCVTSPVYREVPYLEEIPAEVLDKDKNVAAEGDAVLDVDRMTGGINATGTSGGLSYVISGITVRSIRVRAHFSYLSGPAKITIWQGTNTGSTGLQLGSMTTGFTASTASLSVSVAGSASSPKTVTVVISMSSGTTSAKSLFTVDSISYQTQSISLVTSLYTRCGQPKDKYEFGFDGQMKMNEIAGVGNHNTALFWEYDTRLGRRWNLDPKPNSYESQYSCFGDNPIRNTDKLGDVISAMNKTSAQYGIRTVHKIFGKHAKEFANLFTLDKKDGLTFNRIDEGAFRKAYNSIGGSNKDQQQALKDLALAYYAATNSKNEMYYGFISSDRQVEFKNKNVSEYLKRQYETKAGKYGLGLYHTGGGNTVSNTLGTSTFSGILIGNANMALFGVRGSKASEEELFTHEVIGEGFGMCYLKAVTDKPLDFVSREAGIYSIQISNLYYRAMGMAKYRDGSDHHDTENMGSEAGKVPSPLILGRYIFGR